MVPVKEDSGPKFLQFAVLLALFIVWEYRTGHDAILPLHLLKTKSMLGACLEGVCMITTS